MSPDEALGISAQASGILRDRPPDSSEGDASRTVQGFGSGHQRDSTQDGYSIRELRT